MKAEAKRLSEEKAVAEKAVAQKMAEEKSEAERIAAEKAWRRKPAPNNWPLEGGGEKPCRGKGRCREGGC